MPANERRCQKWRMALPPLARAIYRRLAQACVGASAGLVSALLIVYHHQYRWWPDGCFGTPRPWLAGVGSSLEMAVALDPLLDNALEFGGCFVWAFALLGAALPTRLSLRAFVAGAALALLAALAPLALQFNHWHWTWPTTQPCERAPGQP